MSCSLLSIIWSSKWNKKTPKSSRHLTKIEHTNLAVFFDIDGKGQLCVTMKNLNQEYFSLKQNGRIGQPSHQNS